MLRPNKLIILLTVFFVILFINLGFWQLSRAQEKKTMIQAANKEALMPFLEWNPHQPLPHQYQRVELVGQYLPALLFLDNQHYQHQFGYDVLSPFKLANGNIVIVDRGFVRGDISRRELPIVSPPPATTTKVIGEVYFPAKNWVLGPVIEIKGHDKAIIESLDIESISSFLHAPLYPFIMRLAKSVPHGFVRDWSVSVLRPERHYGYAVQWFTLALVIIILCFVFVRKKDSHEKS